MSKIDDRLAEFEAAIRRSERQRIADKLDRALASAAIEGLSVNNAVGHVVRDIANKLREG